MIIALLLVTASTSAFIALVHKTARIHRATEAPELDDEALSALSTAATRMQLEGRFSRSVTRRARRYLPYAQAARWARGLGLSTEQDWLDWVGLGEGKNTYIPSRPGDYYGGRGEWISWAHYLVGDTDEVVAPQREVLPQEYFAELNYVSDSVPWDLRGKPQPAVRKAWAAGAFRQCREILDCGCGAGPRLLRFASTASHLHAIDAFLAQAPATTQTTSRAAATPSSASTSPRRPWPARASGRRRYFPSSRRRGVGALRGRVVHGSIEIAGS